MSPHDMPFHRSTSSENTGMNINRKMFKLYLQRFNKEELMEDDGDWISSNLNRLKSKWAKML